MNTKQIKTAITISIIALIAILGLITSIMYFSYNNQHKDYHTRFEAEESNIENRLDNMWKIISDKFSMSQEYSTQFKEVARINTNAFSQGGEAWKWINTQLPQIDATVYKEIMNTIETERLSFEQSQKKIIDIVREHNNLVIKAPSSWFISDEEFLKWDVISSNNTKEIMSTRQDERSLQSLKNDSVK